MNILEETKLGKNDILSIIELAKYQASIFSGMMAKIGLCYVITGAVKTFFTEIEPDRPTSGFELSIIEDALIKDICRVNNKPYRPGYYAWTEYLRYTTTQYNEWWEPRIEALNNYTKYIESHYE